MKKKKRTILKPERQLTFMQMAERLPRAKINPTWDLKKLYHESKWKLSPAEKRGIKAGLTDVKAGRVHSHEEVMGMINAQLKEWGPRKRNND